jgi:hypothetical protein
LSEIGLVNAKNPVSVAESRRTLTCASSGKWTFNSIDEASSLGALTPCGISRTPLTYRFDSDLGYHVEHENRCGYCQCRHGFRLDSHARNYRIGDLCGVLALQAPPTLPLVMQNSAWQTQVSASMPDEPLPEGLKGLSSYMLHECLLRRCRREYVVGGLMSVAI